MQNYWSAFIDQIEKEGRKILASNLNAGIPKLKSDNTLWLQLPNETMKKEVERDQYDLIEYLKQKLNNHFIKLEITVNAKTEKKYAFTSEDKYKKLQEKNPLIDLLRKEFDLYF